MRNLLLPMVTDDMVEAACRANFRADGLDWDKDGDNSFRPPMRAALEAALACAPSHDVAAVGTLKPHVCANGDPDNCPLCNPYSVSPEAPAVRRPSDGEIARVIDDAVAELSLDGGPSFSFYEQVVAPRIRALFDAEPKA